MNLTPTQQQFIRDNYKTMTHYAMAVELKIKETNVAYFCRLNNLRKTEIKRSYKTRVKKIIVPEPVKNIKRPPADHTNKSREDYVNYWLGL